MAAACRERGEAALREEGMAGAGEEEEKEDGEENILYDLLVNTEWPPETEVQPRGNRKHGASFIITRAITGPALFLLRYIWYSPAKFSLPTGLVRLVSKQINWHLVLAREILEAFTVPKDPNPQWRRVAWSHDCTLLAYAESTGTVRVFDLMGSELLVISPTASFPGDLSYAIAGLIFLEYKASAQWSAELLVVNYRGELRSYLVRLLLVGGCETDEDGVSKAAGCGISAWRVLSGSPHYKQVTSYEDDIRTDGVFKMNLSPDGALLAAVHFSGKLTIWSIPSLRQQGEWDQTDQIDNEEYGEALSLAQAYGLDSDLVYQRQWRKSAVNVASIQDYLESNVRALEILFTFHGSALLPHRQAILSNFPETTSPHEYAFLLPEACYSICRGICLAEDWDCIAGDVHGTAEKSNPFRNIQATKTSRNLELPIKQKEQGKVDCALSLVRLGMERNIPGLQVLCDNLITLETVVYETDGDRTLTLKELVDMKDIEKLRLLMKNCQQKIIPDQDQLMIMALECIYSCERDNQLALCYDILECLPQRGYGVSELLEKHGLQKPVSFVKDTKDDAEEARKLMIRLTRHTGRKLVFKGGREIRGKGQ
ncbi:neuroblastoma-amplified sequence isoform x2 [Limosa lapponica baueri]|uniref:Neuroblastoma-amplified sequence isoform x2 n=1 Tax=Limosa lapponica baueri TaxID=1758121 RepID=A0A2I0U4J6_LIMLA|nr:neuroblastoma-amplified sequence isoform x2 [Limosa lapponica baueri]